MFNRVIFPLSLSIAFFAFNTTANAGRCEFEGILGHCTDSKGNEHWDCVQLGQIRWVCWTQIGNVWTSDCPECDSKNTDKNYFEIVNISKNKCVLRFPGGKCYCLTDRKFSLCECCIDECEVINFSSANICKMD